MRRSSSSDRMSLGAPLRVRQDDNRQSSAQKHRHSASSSAGPAKSGRSLSGNRISIGGRPSISGNRPYAAGGRSLIPTANKFGSGHQSRLSRGSSIGTRNGVAKDPRPLSDKSYQQKCMKTVLEFLTERGYPHNISLKNMQTPTAKEFFRIFEFIYGWITPKYKIGPKPEEEIPRLLKMVGYPFLISKTSMCAIGTPHTWPHMLAALTFLIELIHYIMAAGDSVEKYQLFPSEDGFDAPSENKISYQYVSTSYQAYLDGKDEYIEEEEQLKTSLRQTLLGVGGIENLIAENESLEKQLESLEQDPDRLKATQERRDNLQIDVERFDAYLSELETHKKQQEQILSEVEDQCSNLAIELESENAKILKMQLIHEQQEFTPEDVERINMRRRELQRQKEDVERNCQAFDEDIWKEEIAMSKELEKIQAKCQVYNMLAHSLKLIPINAENSSGIDFELKKTAYNEGTGMDFQDRIKPALLTLKAQCAESASRANSEKIKVMELLEQVSEYVSDLKNEYKLLESKYKRSEQEVEAKKQMYQAELKHIQELVDDLQNEMIQLNSTMFLSEQTANSERKKIDAWELQEQEKALKRLEEYKNFFKEALRAFMEHMETMEVQLQKAYTSSAKIYEQVKNEAKAKGIE